MKLPLSQESEHRNNTMTILFNAVLALLLISPTLGFTKVNTIPLFRRTRCLTSQTESYLDPEGIKSKPPPAPAAKAPSQVEIKRENLIPLLVNDFQGVSRQSTTIGPVGSANPNARDEKKRLYELHAAGGVLSANKRMLAPSSSSSSSSTALKMSATAVMELAKPKISYLDPLGIKPKPPPAQIVVREPDDTFIPLIVDTFQSYRPRHICDPPFLMYEHYPPGLYPEFPWVLGYVYEG